uniref:Aminopeptidase N n=1 Tax=Spodoptera exigua TaxID=7107 RepID=Q5UVJ2_SPOEX|nr:aminopeptidase N [Spodoptera exigua]
MVAIKLIVLSLACLSAAAVSPIEPSKRNTIFADERFEGEVFENVDAFDNIELTNVGASPYRLPTTTAPVKYDLSWTISFTPQRTYSGTVTITLEAKQPNVNQIVIHSDHTVNSNVQLRFGQNIIPTDVSIQKEYQFFIVTLRDGVLSYNETHPIQYTLSIDFTGTFRTDMYGIYESWFRNTPQEPVQWMATTQFQATAARYAFPCYDEPSFKAKFNVNIRLPQNYNSWFCTKLIKSDTYSTTEKIDYYEETPKMSTYLLALIVADYGKIDNGQVDKYHEVIARRGALADNQGDYALKTGEALLTRMSTITDYDFYSQDSNLKMTQAAIPDFGAGAMENWGLLTYREAYLLSDPTHTSSHFKQIIAYILSHEIAHMWYGNLVTNDWWDVLWLNEGFARYYQYFSTYEVEDLGFNIRFVPEQVHTALLSDSSNNPHPLTNPGVGSPRSVSAMFSTISYNKGAAIIRMTEHLLGKNVHDIGLRKYLKDNEFGTTTPIDLFNALNEAGVANGAFNNYPSFDFVAYYKSWTEQPGHPILNVHINHTSGQMTIHQRRFNINTGYSLQNTLYDIPITFTTAYDANFVNTKPTHIIKEPITVIDRGYHGDHWTIFNIKQTGFYRVNYDDYSWNLIALGLRGPSRLVIDELNKAQIVNDVFSFARAGIMRYDRALHILSFLAEEDQYAPWVAAVTGFNWLRNRLVGHPLLAVVDDLIRTWSTKVMSGLTYEPTILNNEDETFMRRYFRFQLAPLMCNVGVQECRDKAKTLFERLKQTPPVNVDRDSRNWVYCNGLRQGTEADFTLLWNKFINENLYTEKIVLLQTLGCTPHRNSLNALLGNILQRTDPAVRPQDYNTALNAAVSGNEGNTQIVLDYFKIDANLQALRVAYNDDLRTPLSYISARLRNAAEVEDFQAWVKASNLGIYETDILDGAEQTLKSFEFVASIANDLDNYFTGTDDPISTTTSGPSTTVSPVTVTAPPLVQPTTPVLPSSAVTSIISIFLLTLAGIAHIIV